MRRNVNLYFVRVFFMAPYEDVSSAGAFYREAADVTIRTDGRTADRIVSEILLRIPRE